MCYISDPQTDQVAGPKLTANRQVEKSQITDAQSKLKSDPNGPDFSELEGRLLTDQFTLIPWHPGVRNILA